MKRDRLIAAVIAALMSAPHVAEADTSEQRLAAIVARVLAFDRNLKDRSGDVLTIGVLAPSGASAETDSLIRSLQGLRDLTVQGLPFRVVALEWRTDAELASAMENHRVNALFVARGFGRELDSIVVLCRKRHVLTVAAEASYLSRGLSTGVFEEGGRPKIYVNLGASRSEGVAYLPEFLRIAKIVEQ